MRFVKGKYRLFSIVYRLIMMPNSLKFNELPESIKVQIRHHLMSNNFLEAKQMYDQFLVDEIAVP
jgi:hypothetical protein